MIYFISGQSKSSPVKIGYTSFLQPWNRLEQVQQGNPERLRVLAIIRDGDRKEEKKIHEKFSSCRLAGEWFERTEPLMDFISTLDITLDDPTLTRSENFKVYVEKKEHAIARKMARKKSGLLRMANARNLLTTSALSVADVARQVGLSIRSVCRLRDDPKLNWLAELGSC